MPSQPPTEPKYVFVWSETTSQTPKPYQSGSTLIIRPTSTSSTNDDTWPCTASFKWTTLEAEFECYYDSTTDLYSDFNLLPDTCKGGMEDVESVIISLHRELDDEKVEVMDANGNLFLFVLMEFGEREGTLVSADLWGKKALEGERNVKVARLEEGEREDLELERWDEGERVVHERLLEGLGGKVIEVGKVEAVEGPEAVVGKEKEGEGVVEKGAGADEGELGEQGETGTTGGWDAGVANVGGDEGGDW